jgi:hypothetical protein
VQNLRFKLQKLGVERCRYQVSCIGRPRNEPLPTFGTETSKFQTGSLQATSSYCRKNSPLHTFCYQAGQNDAFRRFLAISHIRRPPDHPSRSSLYSGRVSNLKTQFLLGLSHLIAPAKHNNLRRCFTMTQRLGRRRLCVHVEISLVRRVSTRVVLRLVKS